MLFEFVSSINNIYKYMYEYYADGIALKRPRYAPLTRPLPHNVTYRLGGRVAKKNMVAELHRHASTTSDDIRAMSEGTYENSCSYDAYPQICPVLASKITLRCDTPRFSMESVVLKRYTDTLRRATGGINSEMYGRTSDAGVIGYYGHSRMSDDFEDEDFEDYDDTSYSISGCHGTCTSRSVDSTAASYGQRAPGSTRTAHL